MKYLVCLKEVPNTKNIETDENGSLKRDTVGSTINKNDEFALSAVLKLNKLKKANTIALTMGPKHSRACLRRALSLGIEKAVHLKDNNFQGSDVYASAYTLSVAIKNEENVDVVILGSSTSDGDTGQVPGELAAALKYNFANNVSRINSISDSEIELEQEDGIYKRTLKITLPIVLSVKEGAFERVESTYREKILAMKKTIIEKDASSLLNVDLSRLGYKGSKTRLKNMFVPSSNRDQIIKEANLFDDIKDCLKFKKLDIDKNCKKKAKCEKYLLVLDKSLDSTLEMASELYNIDESPHIDVISLNASDELISKIKKSNLFDKLINIKSKTVMHIDYINALKKIDLSKYKGIFAVSSPLSKAYLSHVSYEYGFGLTADCVDFSFNDKNEIEQIRPAYSEMLYATIVSVNNGKAVATYKAGEFEIKIRDQVRDLIIENYKIKSSANYIVINETMIDVEEGPIKDIIVVIGNVIKSKEELKQIEDFADSINASFGATRPLVQGGLVDHSKQIGVSGHLVKCKVAILLGVSGSAQTMAGLKHVGKIISVNKDEHAAVFKNTDIGYIKDYKEIIGG